MAVARTSTGAFVSGTAGVTPLFASGSAAGNFGLLLTETANEAVTAPTGWSVFNSVSIGTAGAIGATRSTVLSRNSITSGEVASGVSVADPGDHVIAALLSYSGVDATTPLVSSGQFTGSPATTSVALDNFNTTVASGDIVLAVIATDRDSATLSTNTSASWTGVTGTSSGFILNGSTASGAGGGVVVHELVVTSNFTGQVNFSCSITSSIWAGWIVVIKQAATGRTATLAKTLDVVTSSSNAKLKLSGTLAKTLATVTLSDTAKLLLQGSLAKTLSAVTLSSASKLKLSGTLAKTLDTATASSSAKLLIKATDADTLGTLTLSSLSKLLIKGTLAKSLGSLTLSSNSKLLINANLAKTLGVVTLGSQALVYLRGSLTQSLGTLTVVSSSQLLIKSLVSVSLRGISLSSLGQHVSLSVTGSLTKDLSQLQIYSTTHTVSPKTVKYITPFRSSIRDQINRSRIHRPRVNTQRIRT